MSVNDLLDDIASTVEAFVIGNMTPVHADRKIGLDMRCGPIYINEDCIAVDTFRAGSLEYYGGFEYVDKEYRHEAGGYIFYLGEDSRVRDHIDRFYSEEAA